MKRDDGSSKSAAAIAMTVSLVIFSAGCSASRNPEPPLVSAVSSPALQVDADVERVLLDSCYPCHANERNDPWYARLAPSSWSSRGRAALNFDEWQTYDRAKRSAEMAAIAAVVQDGYMPLKDYTFFNRAAKLSDAQRQEVVRWASAPALAAH